MALREVDTLITDCRGARPGPRRARGARRAPGARRRARRTCRRRSAGCAARAVVRRGDDDAPARCGARRARSPTAGRSSTSTTRPGAPPRTVDDTRELGGRGPRPAHVRYDALVGDWVAVAGHRMNRTLLPPRESCPLCPTGRGPQPDRGARRRLRRGRHREPLPLLRPGRRRRRPRPRPVRAPPGARPHRGGLLHQRPRRVASPPSRRAGCAPSIDAWADRTACAVRARRRSSRSSASRTAGRRSG